MVQVGHDIIHTLPKPKFLTSCIARTRLDLKWVKIFPIYSGQYPSSSGEIVIYILVCMRDN